LFCVSVRPRTLLWLSVNSFYLNFMFWILMKFKTQKFVFISSVN
jgi:hypothetical protein